MTRRLLVLAMAAAIVVCGASLHAQVKGIGRLVGKVSDEKGTPVEAVSVRLRQAGDTIEGKSDAKGEWTLAGVARGNWVVTFEKEGLPTQVVRVIVEKELLRPEPIKVTMKKGS